MANNIPWREQCKRQSTRALKAALATTQNKKQIGPIRRRDRHSAMPDKQPQLGMFSLYNINTFTQVPESTTQLIPFKGDWSSAHT